MDRSIKVPQPLHGKIGLIGPGALGRIVRRGTRSGSADGTDAARFGFVAFAETWNGRLAMLGFVIGLATELLTGQGILSQIGLG